MEEAEDLEKEVNNVIEKTEWVIKGILENAVTCSINVFACSQPVVKFRSLR